jgi:hypothetical protein
MTMMLQVAERQVEDGRRRQRLEILETPAGGTRYEWISVSAVRAAGVKPATVTVNGNGFVVASFADNQEQQIQANLKIPDMIDTSQPISICVGWSSPATGADCDWELTYLVTAMNEATDAAGATVQSYETSSAVADGLVVSELGSITVSSGDICIHVILERDGNDANDTLGAVAEVHGLALKYTRL